MCLIFTQSKLVTEFRDFKFKKITSWFVKWKSEFLK